MASKRRNMFQKNKTQETTENANSGFCGGIGAVRGGGEMAAMVLLDIVRYKRRFRVRGKDANIAMTTRHVFSLGRRALRPVGCGYATGKELAATESDPPDALCPAKCDRDDCAKATKVARTTYDPPKSVRVTVLGAADPVGRAMCLQLKLNPLVREMRMYDDRGTLALATDLSYINTVCKVTNFSGENQLAGALRVLGLHSY
ncbi:hypothetical protein AAG570_003977 [Ranatra chinensis]|uniref:Uncharacterized protein n=1 Tax=Ranatra chinensis TaxID=642074 RepID=A0ABD0Y2F9_9HEMI